MINQDAIIQLFSDVVLCNQCNPEKNSNLLKHNEKNVPQPGYIGKNYEQHRVLLIGRNPGECPSNPIIEARDLSYMKALLNLSEQQTNQAYQELYNTILNNIPQWPIVQNYFPLKECGLDLPDIAFCNVVRCRTKDNVSPSASQVQICKEHHLIKFIDTIEPKVIVCIGKWAYDRIKGLSSIQSIPKTYINMDKSLNAKARQTDKERAGKIVKQYKYS